MRTRLAIVFMLLSHVLFAPVSAQAKAIEDVQIAADPADLVVSVVANVPLRTPTIRTYAGLIRVRFYDVMQPASLRVSGDGGALRAAELGRGSDQTAALTLVLGDQTKLAPADVRVEASGNTTTLRLARGLLPAIREGALTPQAAAPASAQPRPIAAAKPAAPAPAAAPQAEGAQAAPRAEAPAEQPAAPAVAPVPAAPVPEAKAPALGKPKPVDKSSESDSKLTGGETSTLPLLLSLTALLGFAYLGLQLYLRKRSVVADIPAIDVVAQKRLGPRHQLVIVRAFDRDYLLSIQGGQTTVVARSTRKKVEATSDSLAPVASRVARAPTRDFEDDDEVTFGGELFKQALEQRERAREKSQAIRVDPAQREARKARPRSELDEMQVDGGYPEDGRILGNDGRITRNPEPEPRVPTLEERLAAAEAAEAAAARTDEEPQREPVPEGMSESVTGLLRLRKQAGR